jgi:serine protease AprX
MSKFTVNALVGAMLAAATIPVHANALLGTKLQSLLTSPSSGHKVIVTTHHRSDLDQVMASLNLPYLAMTVLPMAGATLTQDQITALSNDPRVKSIYQDSPLQYYNYTSGEITGGHYVHDVEGVTGRGTTIAVLDSGVDATHPDLLLGEKTIQNVKIIGDLDFAGGRTLFLEDIPNTDTSSGHGTHVGGTVAGTGAASANDERRGFYHAGIAPDATLVGLGAGEAISILYALVGFDYAIANHERFGIDVITNSWGGGDGANFDPNNPINQASYEAYTKGIVVTFAASNSGPAENTLNQYAIAPWVINVAAGTADHGLANFSSRGVAGDEIKQPDITAPGSNIISARAVNTPLPALGPVQDPNHPEYHLRYASMSGTSMATPFVAGVVGLLLEVNPQLSPDQIEDIIRQSADPMPGFQSHQVGSGYINVKSAVELARSLKGKRAEFMQGNTAWSSQGKWQQIPENDKEIQYISAWKSVNNGLSSQGSFLESRRKGAEVAFDFIGDSAKVQYLANQTNGHAEVFLNGKSQGVIDFFAQEPTAKTFALRGLATSKVHRLEIKRIEGRINFDGLELDGRLVPNGSQIVNSQQQFEGTIGPSVENIQVADFPIQVSQDTVLLNALLSWSGVADLDFELLNDAGEVVANSASLNNPEEISYRPATGGTYTLRVKGYASVNTPYTLDVNSSRMTSR